MGSRGKKVKMGCVGGEGRVSGLGEERVRTDGKRPAEEEKVSEERRRR